MLNQQINIERRVALTPAAVKKLREAYSGLSIYIETGAGEGAQYADADYAVVGAEVISAVAVKKLQADILLTVSANPKLEGLKQDGAVIGFLDPASNKAALVKLAGQGYKILPVELIPRTSRAQAMDALSSQTGIAGYRAVLEAATHYPRFFPLMMTAAGAAKPAHVIVLGVGVAGLQAIATARRLGAQVSAFDIRPESKEQVESLGAKFLDFDLGEMAQSEGGYAKELSPAAREKQQELLQGALSKADVVVTTAQVPGRPAPVLVTEDAVKNMRKGSVVLDMAAGGYNAANGIKGGNCPLTQADEVVVKHGVTLVGYTNYPSMVAGDASNFYANNLVAFLQLILKDEAGTLSLHFDGEDDIIAATLMEAK